MDILDFGVTGMRSFPLESFLSEQYEQPEQAEQYEQPEQAEQSEQFQQFQQYEQFQHPLFVAFSVSHSG